MHTAFTLYLDSYFSLFACLPPIPTIMPSYWLVNEFRSFWDIFDFLIKLASTLKTRTRRIVPPLRYQFGIDFPF